MEEAINSLLENPTLYKAGILLIAILFIVLISKLVQRNLISRISESDRRYKFKKLTTFIGYLAVIIVLLIIYADNLGGLTIALGVAGAGIAFALQEVITSFAGWLAILFGGFYKTGDRVQLGGIKGDVMDIGVLRTTLMEIGQWVDGDLYNGRIVLVANSFIFKEPVFNYSGDFPFLWDEIKVPVQYGSNYDKAKILFYDIAKSMAGDLSELSQEKWIELQRKYLLENAITEPIVTIIANDNWVEFTIRYVVNYKRRRITKSNLFTKILEEVAKPDNQIKLASATFHIVEAPDLNVRLKN
jgi:small-conductance mechanosensitive channel